MQACFEPEQGFSKSMPKPVFEICQSPRLFQPTPPFINFGCFCQPPRLLFWSKYASRPYIPSSPSI